MRTLRLPTALDAVVAGALAVAAQLEIWTPRLVPGVGEVVGTRPVLAVTALVATVPLALRRRYPLTVLLLVLGALVAQRVLTTPTDGLVLLIAAMVAAYASSAWASPAHAAAAGGLIVLGAAGIGKDVSDGVFVAVVVGGAWLVGFVVLQRSTDLARARDDNRELADRLAEAAQRLAEAERKPAFEAAPEQLAALTVRELEVVRAIARGMANAEIARELFISEWTVKTHVASILRKLGLRDRSQVVAAAYESGLVRPRQQ
ncbi:response regulator transcription factor [Nocardioides panacisoli]|uniref:HTH luxR-type domain-containing protein n=1 Tax=Nocardioides panacisoli TaxID=627624 RepID=A0ABP7HQX5_9ACTN